jgi:Chaperone of endosialidase
MSTPSTTTAYTNDSIISTTLTSLGTDTMKIKLDQPDHVILSFNDNPTVLSGVANPINTSDATNKEYVDNKAVTERIYTNGQISAAFNEPIVQFGESTIVDFTNTSPNAVTIEGGLDVRSRIYTGKLIVQQGIGSDDIESIELASSLSDAYLKFGNYKGYVTLKHSDSIPDTIVLSHTDNASVQHPVFIDNVAEPIVDSHAANKQYVDKVSTELVAVRNEFITSLTTVEQSQANYTNNAIAGVELRNQLYVDNKFNNNVTFNSTTDSVSPVTGSVIIAGGLGVAKNIFAGGSVSALQFTATSDATLKTDITEVGNASLVARQARIVNFNWTENPTRSEGSFHSTGVIAQEFQQLVPHAVRINSTTGLLGVDYNIVASIALAAVKDALTRCDELEARCAYLEAKLSN